MCFFESFLGGYVWLSSQTAVVSPKRHSSSPNLLLNINNYKKCCFLIATRMKYRGKRFAKAWSVKLYGIVCAGNLECTRHNANLEVELSRFLFGFPSGIIR